MGRRRRPRWSSWRGFPRGSSAFSEEFIPIFGMKWPFRRGRKAEPLLPEAEFVREMYRRLLAWAAARGHARKAAQTPYEYLPGLVAWLPERGGDLAFLTEQYVRTRYSPAIPGESGLEELRQSWLRIRQTRRAGRAPKMRGIRKCEITNQTLFPPAAEVGQIKEAAERLLQNVNRVIVGKKETIQLVFIALLCEGHVLIEDVPGVGKTLLAKAMARSAGCRFKRIQCTPDLLPSDVTGIHYFNQKTSAFEFRPGPILANIVLVDEINRAMPRTQSSLLECMQEQQVTVDLETMPLPRPFIILATQNPIELEGTFPLPEAQLDRFLFRVRLGYPEDGEEEAILTRFHESNPLEDLAGVLDAKTGSGSAEAVPSGFCGGLCPPVYDRFDPGNARPREDSVGGQPAGIFGTLPCLSGEGGHPGEELCDPRRREIPGRSGFGPPLHREDRSPDEGAVSGRPGEGNPECRSGSGRGKGLTKQGAESRERGESLSAFIRVHPCPKIVRSFEFGVKGDKSLFNFRHFRHFEF
jgi:DNA polymerase III delta prime subunit